MEPFDCEALASGFPTQPVNTVSSLVFVLGALVLWRRGHRVASAALVTAGVGSMAFHGAPSGASSWLHDIGLYAAIAVAAVELWRRASTHRIPGLPVAVFGAGAAVWFWSRTDGPLCNPESVIQGHAVWHALSTLAILILFLSAHPLGDPVHRE